MAPISELLHCGSHCFFPFPNFSYIPTIYGTYITLRNSSHKSQASQSVGGFHISKKHQNYLTVKSKCTGTVHYEDALWWKDPLWVFKNWYLDWWWTKKLLYISNSLQVLFSVFFALAYWHCFFIKLFTGFLKTLKIRSLFLLRLFECCSISIIACILHFMLWFLLHWSCSLLHKMWHTLMGVFIDN